MTLKYSRICFSTSDEKRDFLLEAILFFTKQALSQEQFEQLH